MLVHPASRLVLCRPHALALSPLSSLILIRPRDVSQRAQKEQRHCMHGGRSTAVRPVCQVCVRLWYSSHAVQLISRSEHGGGCSRACTRGAGRPPYGFVFLARAPPPLAESRPTVPTFSSASPPPPARRVQTATISLCCHDRPSSPRPPRWRVRTRVLAVRQRPPSRRPTFTLPRRASPARSPQRPAPLGPPQRTSRPPRSPPRAHRLACALASSAAPSTRTSSLPPPSVAVRNACTT